MCVRELCFSLLALIATPVVAIASDAEIWRFQGKWEIIELVEDGNVIPENAIADWLPSGGRLEIVDNAVITVSAHDEKRRLRSFR